MSINRGVDKEDVGYIYIYIHTVEYYSALEKNQIMPFAVRWFDLESVIQSEVSQKEENKYCMLTHIYGI